ncbi:DoxX family protein [Blastopirellula sp. JC732]|uniref:DoxX family protein n=1 Tax=Blastopirellula sediminis TaxID=2894196 RepID=A0A9X1MH10_9BACT|nr:DoxX family protein [Blastopirellula sediminis]MCC9604408.1 DoxX family protein [Blastopirellula sediminis]MCC9626928.1 DoxX family protein [Blastopirellula sediminis]
MSPTASRFLPYAATFVRVALAASFLSAVADRFGIWTKLGSSEVAWGNMEQFLAYTRLLLWFLPGNLANTVGWTATVLEVTLAVALLAGIAIRRVALLSGILLLSFGVSMTLATGPEGPLSYSVWTAAAASFLLATLDPSTTGPSLWRKRG